MQRVLGAIGIPSVIARDSRRLGESGHITLLSSLTNPLPFYFLYHEHHNAGDDFHFFVEQAIQQGYLIQGDYLIMDNAAVHFDMNRRNATEDLLRQAGVCLSS